MTSKDVQSLLGFTRRKTIELLDGLEKRPDSVEILGWRPGPGRAHVAWQLMHLAATEDRHLHVRMRGGEPTEPEYVRRFAGGSVVDDEIPTVAEIRRYLDETRAAMIEHVQTLSEADFDAKPNEAAPWIYSEWFNLLAWHEGHHHGQAHLTLNLHKAAHPTD